MPEAPVPQRVTEQVATRHFVHPLWASRCWMRYAVVKLTLCCIHLGPYRSAVRA